MFGSKRSTRSTGEWQPHTRGDGPCADFKSPDGDRWQRFPRGSAGGHLVKPRNGQDFFISSSCLEGRRPMNSFICPLSPPGNLLGCVKCLNWKLVILYIELRESWGRLRHKCPASRLLLGDGLFTLLSPCITPFLSCLFILLSLEGHRMVLFVSQFSIHPQHEHLGLLKHHSHSLTLVGRSFCQGCTLSMRHRRNLGYWPQCKR